MAKKIDWNKMAKATEKSKVHIARHYHTIGILGIITIDKIFVNFYGIDKSVFMQE